MQQTLGMTLTAFTLMTLGIYFAAYLPLLLTPGSGYRLAGIVQAQADTFAYHSAI